MCSVAQIKSWEYSRHKRISSLEYSQQVLEYQEINVAADRLAFYNAKNKVHLRFTSDCETY